MADLQRFDLTFFAFWSVVGQGYLWGTTLCLKYLGVGKCLPALLNAPHLSGKGDTLLFGVAMLLTGMHVLLGMVFLLMRGR